MQCKKNTANDTQNSCCTPSGFTIPLSPLSGSIDWHQNLRSKMCTEQCSSIWPVFQPKCSSAPTPQYCTTYCIVYTCIVFCFSDPIPLVLSKEQRKAPYLDFLVLWLESLLITNEFFLHQQVVLDALQLEKTQTAFGMRSDWSQWDRREREKRSIEKWETQRNGEAKS